MIKKILISFLFIFIVSCGFQPMLKDFDTSSLVIKQINYTGKNELTYSLKSYLNLKESPNNSSDYILNLNINEITTTANKNTAGITTQEDYTLVINLIVTNSKLEVLLNDTFSETKRLDVTNNLASDDSNKRVEQRKIMQNLTQKIKFKILILSKQNK